MISHLKKKNMADCAGLSHDLETWLHFHSTYFKDLFSSPKDINVGETKTFPIFSRARKRSVPLDFNSMVD